MSRTCTAKNLVTEKAHLCSVQVWTKSSNLFTGHVDLKIG